MAELKALVVQGPDPAVDNVVRWRCVDLRQKVADRFNVDGSPDTSFGVGGRVTSDFSGGARREGATSVELQPDGKIIVGGNALNNSGWAQVAFARYNANGSLDPTFGTAGKVIFTTSTTGIGDNTVDKLGTWT